MAIQISGCTVIDNSRNITNANNMCVGLVTMTGSTGSIETPGTIIAGGVDLPPSPIFFSPSNGATQVRTNEDINIVFNTSVKKGTGNITLRNSSGIGTVLQTIGVTSTSVTINESVVTINPPTNLPDNTNVFVVVDAGAFNTSVGDSELIDTYNFTTGEPEPGDQFEGGFIICTSQGVQWIVAPSDSQVIRTWFCRNDAITTAQQVSGCTGWFIPTCGQLQNPGYCCRTFWDSFTAAAYWSDTISSQNIVFPPANPDMRTTYTCSFALNFDTGAAGPCTAPNCLRLRSFRCVTY